VARSEDGQESWKRRLREAPKDVVGWFQQHPYLQTDNPEPVTVGGVKGQQLDGFKGLIALGDRQNGKVIGVALWESEEALRATEETAARLRGGTPEATGATVAGAENYEVAIFEVSS
jgi:hypothetical protein